MKRTYSDDFIATALAELALNQGNQKATAKKLGVSRGTLQKWELMQRALTSTKKAGEVAVEYDFVGMFAQTVSLLNQRLQALAPSMTNSRDTAIALGIAVDKHLDYRDGRKGTEVMVNNIIPVQVIVKDGEAI